MYKIFVTKCRKGITQIALQEKLTPLCPELMNQVVNRGPVFPDKALYLLVEREVRTHTGPQASTNPA